MTTIRILAIESSTPTLGVGLLVLEPSGKQHFYQQQHQGSSQHAEHILPLVDKLLGQAQCRATDLTAVAFGQGPGGFTGLRVACGVAQGMGYGLDIPLLPVSSLLAVAQGQRAVTADIQVVIADARMQELYVAAYAPQPASQALALVATPPLQQGAEQSPPTVKLKQWQQLHAPILIEAQHLLAWLTEQQSQWGAQISIHLVGSGLAVCRELGIDLSAFATGPEQAPAVKDIAQLGLWGWQQGQGIAAQFAAPLYIRDKVAFTIQERATGQGGNPSADWQPLAVQPIQAQHLPAICALNAQLQTQPWSLEQWQSGLQSGQYGWLLQRGEQVLAFLWVTQGAGVAELLLVGTHPDYQQRGYARWLLDTWHDHLGTQAVDELQLEVRATNVAAQKLYEAFGFEQVGRRKNYYKKASGAAEDAWLYSKKLGKDKLKGGQ